MTIEYRETIYGRQHGEPKKAETGKQETISFLPLTPWHTPFIESLRVESPDAISTIATVLPFPASYKKEQINRRDLKSSPFNSLKDLVLWRRRHYSWREDK